MIALKMAAVFFVLAFAAAIVGFSGAFRRGGVADAARLLFSIFLVAFLVAFIIGVKQS